MGYLWGNLTKIISHLKTMLSGLTVVFFGSLLGVAVVTFLFWAAPRVEARIFPVMSDYEVTTVVKEKDHISLYGSFMKNRSCSLDTFTVYTVDKDQIVVSLPIHFTNQITDPTERPIGKNYFGPWILDTPYLPKSNPFPLYVLLKHDCTPLWSTISIFGPFEIKY